MPLSGFSSRIFQTQPMLNTYMIFYGLVIFSKRYSEELAQPVENLPVRSSLLVVVVVKCLSHRYVTKVWTIPSTPNCREVCIGVLIEELLSDRYDIYHPTLHPPPEMELLLMERLATARTCWTPIWGALLFRIFQSWFFRQVVCSLLNAS